MKNLVLKLKYTIPALLIALLAIVTLASPALAIPEEPIPEETANATYVILWGDNATLTIDIPGDLTLGDVEVTGLSDFLENLFLFVIMAGITALVVLSKSIFGKSITSILLVVYGLRMAIPEETWAVLWMAGVVIALLGTSLLFKVIQEAIIQKMQKGKNGE